MRGYSEVPEKVLEELAAHARERFASLHKKNREKMLGVMIMTMGVNGECATAIIADPHQEGHMTRAAKDFLALEILDTVSKNLRGERTGIMANLPIMASGVSDEQLDNVH
ncbi:hypothetical protein [Acidithiobacillus ferridurans]|uniref:Uncharacterized protein n=1 Tax=Acidithiobacillus ferridurans TaxID=1232575 RepID=A0A8X8KAG7_ACIFI|nr:hypothetical protein [Acidithiobacillus ferridurans]MBU2715815.1 hypothetical protein [Acidithiobacillus ferridurans]MBU2722812.1 hypothetical protein [Acidithiobacillus ferridurans]MBU2727801.1 hypothetical protein [Acidithiobacillus ferridurans]